MILLDTTVLVYAVDSEHTFRDPCRRLIEAVAEGRIEATTTPEVVQEFVHVRARRRGRDDAVAIGEGYRVLLSPLTAVTEEHLVAGLDLFARPGALGVFDSVLAAVTISIESILVSADAAFAEVPGLRHLIPDRGGIASLDSGI